MYLTESAAMLAAISAAQRAPLEWTHVSAAYQPRRERNTLAWAGMSCSTSCLATGLTTR